MGVVGEGLDDVGTRVHELPVQLGDLLGMLDHHLRYEAPGLQVSASLELKQIALRTDDRAVLQALKQLRHHALLSVPTMRTRQP